MATHVGHVNCAFSETQLDKENESQILDCPFNYRHRVCFADFILHLARCPEAVTNKDKFERCQFNDVHFYPPTDEDRHAHLIVCPNRRVDFSSSVFVKKLVKKVPLQFGPLRDRVGMENPRLPQSNLPNIREILGPSIRFPELEQILTERKPKLDTSEYKIDGMNAYQFVLENGKGSYSQYGQYTSKMSKAEKIRFSKFLEDQRLLIRAGDDNQRVYKNKASIAKK